MTQPTYLIYKNSLYKEKNEALVTYYEKIALPEKEPKPEWKGAKIPLELWQTFQAWAQLTQSKFKSEAMSLLFYDLTSNQWSQWFCPQTSRGMTVKTNPHSSNWKTQRTQYPDLQFGTIHHHCDASAFQSGTDHADEINRDGIHITLGKVLAKEQDIHIRLVINGTTCLLEPADVFELPAMYRILPTRLHNHIIKDLITHPVDVEAYKESMEPIISAAFEEERQGSFFQPPVSRLRSLGDLLHEMEPTGVTLGILYEAIQDRRSVRRHKDISQKDITFALQRFWLDVMDAEKVQYNLPEKQLQEIEWIFEGYERSELQQMAMSEIDYPNLYDPTDRNDDRQRSSRYSLTE